MSRFLFSFLVVSAFMGQNGFTQSTNNDFAKSDDKKEVLSSKDLRARFEVLGEIFVTDGNGKLLLQAEESRVWKFGNTGDILSNWSFSTPFIKEIALRHLWNLSDEGKITVTAQQFDSMSRKNNSREVITGKLIREEKVELKDFSTISWVAHQNAKERVVVRLTPRLGEKSDFIQADGLPLSLGNPVVYDNKGRVWAEGHNLEGKYLSMKTHVGQFAISYTPFKGAREIGFVQGSQVTINADSELKIFIRSAAPILTTSRPAKLYGFVNMKNKSEAANSIHSSSSNKEKEFLEHF